MYFFYIHTTDSTQNHSKALLSLHNNTVPFWTQSQTQAQGRGQRGRVWESVCGNIFLTGCFSPPKKIQPGQFSIAVGVSLSKLLESYLPNNQVGIKWPNDILVEHKKCAGVLIEMSEQIYLGIGVNVASHPDNTVMPATHLNAFATIDSNELVQKIIEIIPNFDELETFQNIQNSWWSLAKDSVPYWKLREAIPGMVIGIDEQGQLVIESEDGSINKRHQTFE